MGLKALYTASTLDAFAFVLVITSVNPYIASIGGTQFSAGILGSISGLINLIFNPLIGSLGDTLGRKTVLLGCLFIALIGNLVSAITSSLLIFFASRLFTCFASQIGVFIRALVDDEVPEKTAKMAAINKMQALGGSCFIFAALVSGFLSEFENGYTYVWYLICGLIAVNIVLITLFTKAQPPTAKSEKTKTEPTNIVLSEITKAINNLKNIDWPRYWDLFTIKIVVDFTLSVQFFSMGYILMSEFGITGKNFGYVFSSIGIMGITTSLTMPKLKKFIYPHDEAGLKRLLHSCFIIIYAYLGLYFSPNFILYYLHLVFIPLARVLYDTTVTEVVLSKAGAHEKGSVMGAFESSMALAGLAAPIFSGFVSDRWGNRFPILLSIVPLAVGALIAYTQLQKGEKPQTEKKRN